jgi:hypothetical protein
VDTCRNAESARCDPALLAQADMAIREFNIALRALVGGEGAPETERLRTAASKLMRVLARVLLRLE